MLNSDSGKLSKDRLRRVQQSKLTAETDEVEVRNTIGLYSDIALLIKNRSSLPSFQLARVIRMRKPGNNRGMIEYHRPVPLNENDQFGNVELIVNSYQQDDEGNYTYTIGDQKCFTLWNVLMVVTMMYDVHV